MAQCLAESFSLKCDDNNFTLVNRNLEVRSFPGQLKVRIAFPGTAYSTDFRGARKIKLKEINVLKNDENIKSIQLKSHVFSFFKEIAKGQYVLTVTSQKQYSFIHISMELVNLSPHTSYAYFYLRLFPTRSDYYFTTTGEYEIKSKYPVFGNWIFFPSDNQATGLGLFYNSKRKNLKLSTIYPAKDWKSAGYYFLSNLKKLSPVPVKSGESNNFSFVIFPCKDENQVQGNYELLKSNKRFMELWK